MKEMLSQSLLNSLHSTHSQQNSSQSLNATFTSLSHTTSAASSSSLTSTARAKKAQAPVLSTLAPTQTSKIKSKTTTDLHLYLRIHQSICNELIQNKEILKQLNPSRRIAITKTLEQLAHFGQNKKTELSDWLEKKLSPEMQGALNLYFEDIACFTLLQCLVLKNWNEKQNKTLLKSQIANLNFEFVKQVKALIPLQHEGWNLTRPNLYSWFTPSPQLQEEIESSLKTVDLRDQNSGLLLDIFNIRHRHPILDARQTGYDERFYQVIWKEFTNASNLKSNPLGLKFYSPSLRQGLGINKASAYLGTQKHEWIGYESNLPQLLCLELQSLWNGVIAPPLWCQAYGLQLNNHSQKTFASLSQSKQSTSQQIAEIESCEIAWLMEEKTIRINDKSKEAQSIRTELEEQNSFKKLKTQNTSLGILQALVSLSKLRPEGKLIWIREEALSQEEGQEQLAQLLNKAKLIAEIDLSQLDHQLPSLTPLYSKYIYIFERDLNPETRNSHKPIKIMVSGQIKSHVEVEPILSEALAHIHAQELQVEKNSYKIIHHKSPNEQKEWAYRWPSQQALEFLKDNENYFKSAYTLSELATIHEGLVSVEKTSLSTSTILVVSAISSVDATKPSSSEQVRSLRTYTHSDWMRLSTEEKRLLEANAMTLICHNELIVNFLKHYLSCQPIHHWLEIHCERKNEEWTLSQNLLKRLPMTSEFMALLKIEDLATQSQYLSLYNGLKDQTLAYSEELLSRNSWHNDTQTQSMTFIAAAQVIEDLRVSQNKIEAYLEKGETIQWHAIMSLMNSSDCLTLPQHPMVRIQGQLPLHSPLRIERTRKPKEALTLITLEGQHMQSIQFEHKLLLEICLQSISKLKNPTWSEIIQHCLVPRQLEHVSSLANDFIQHYWSHDQKMTVLSKLIDLVIQPDLQ